MITNATREMLPRMNALWNQYFGDSLEYSSFFFEHHLKGKYVFENQYVYIKDDKVVSMLTVLEGKLTKRKQKQNFWYIYGVVTDENYRNNGYAGAVLKYVLNKAAKQNILTGLVPANGSLYGYYQKFGFRTYFYKNFEEFNLAVPCKNQYGLKQLDASNYKRLRDQAFYKEAYVEWDEASVEYALMENRKLGGDSWFVQDTPYFLMACPVGENLVVRETNCPSLMLADICNLLGERYGCRRASISSSSLGKMSKDTVRIGMICEGRKPHEIERNEIGYLGLALD